jgi:hypothetical protein
MRHNGHVLNRWAAAEKHFQQMVSRYVTPAIAQAQKMVSRPGTAPERVSAILGLIRQMEAVRKLYAGPLTRSMEGQLAEADKAFRTALAQLERWDR